MNAFTKVAGRSRGLLLSILALAASFALSACATSRPSHSGRMKHVSTVRDVTDAPADATAAMVCPKCKTVEISEVWQEWPNRGDAPKFVTVGSEHSCSNCGGSITFMLGLTDNQMQYNCSICGEDAAFCCVSAPAVPAAK